MATVIRVKRRKIDKPAEALLVVSKAKVSDANHSGRGDIAEDVDKKIFHYATTVPSKSPINHDIKERVRNAILLRHKQNKQLGMRQEKSKHFLQDKNSLLFLKKKIRNMTTSHYNFSNNKEPMIKEPLSRSSSSPAKTHLYSSNKLPEPPRQGLHHLYKQRLHSLAEDQEKPEMPSHSGQYMGQVGRGVDQKTYYQKPSNDDYVYDLYYCQKTGDWNVKDVLYVKPYGSKDVMTKPMKGRTEKQVVAKKLSKPNKSRFIKRGPTPEGDDDSIDEDERRIIFDEEEEFYDSDDYDVNGRDDDDSYTSFFGAGHSDYDNESNFDDYDDDLANDLVYEPDYSFTNDNCDEYGGNDDNN